MAISTIVKTKRDGTIKFTDGTPTTPLTFTVAFEAGDLSVDIPGPSVNVFLDRGAFGTVPQLRYGDDQPMSASFTANLRDLGAVGYATLVGILTQSVKSNTAPWISTLGASGEGTSTTEVFTLSVEWAIEGSDHGDTADQTLTMNHCVITGSVNEGDPDTVSLTIVSYDLYPTVA